MDLKKSKKAVKYNGIGIPDYEKYMSENVDNYKNTEVKYDVKRNNVKLKKIISIVILVFIVIAIIGIFMYVNSLYPKVVEVTEISTNSAGEIQYKPLLKSKGYDEVVENYYAAEEIKIFVEVKEYNDAHQELQYSNRVQITCVNDEKNPYYDNAGDFHLIYDEEIKCFSFTAYKATNGIYEATFYTYKNVKDKINRKNAIEHKVKIEINDGFNSKEEALPIIKQINDIVVVEKKEEEIAAQERERKAQERQKAAEIAEQEKKREEEREQERRQAEEDKIDFRYGGFEILKGTKAVQEYGYAHIKGVVVNNTGINYSYVEINYSIYDTNGNKVATAMDNIRGLKDTESWSFEALGRCDGHFKYKFESIEATEEW